MATNGSDSGVVPAIDTTQEQKQEFNPYEMLMAAASNPQDAGPPEPPSPEPEPEEDYNKPLTDGQDGFKIFDSQWKAEEAMGLGNGGEADQWFQKLTANQKDGLQIYTGAGYKTMNNWMRDKPGASISPTTKARIASLQHALDKYTLPQPIVTHRGMGPEIFGLPANATPSQIKTVVEALIKSGGRVTDKGFTSSSVATGHQFSGSVVVHVQTPAGKGIGAFVSGISSVGKGEHESLYNSGSHMKPIGVYMVGTTVHVNMRYDGRDKSTNKKPLTD